MAWSLFVYFGPGETLTEFSGYSWINIPIWALCAMGTVFGLFQIIVTFLQIGYLRRIGAAIVMGSYVNLAVNVHLHDPQAPIWVMFAILAVFNLILFIWPELDAD